MLKRLLGILIIILFIGGLGGMIYYDFTSHLDDHEIECEYDDHNHVHESHETHGVLDKAIEYVIHITVCLIFCIFLHKPAHRAWKWVLSLIGIKKKDDDCCHH